MAELPRRLAVAAAWMQCVWSMGLVYGVSAGEGGNYSNRSNGKLRGLGTEAYTIYYPWTQIDPAASRQVLRGDLHPHDDTEVRMNRLIAVAILTGALFPVGVSAQASDVPKGERVRVKRTSENTVVGSVESWSPAGVTVFSDKLGRELVISRDIILSVERSVGRERRFARNFGLALGVGAVAGGLIGAATYSPCESTGFMSCFMEPDSRADALGMGALVGAVVGLPIGVIYGLAARHEMWVPVEFGGNPQASVMLRAVSGRHVLAGVALTWRQQYSPSY